MDSITATTIGKLIEAHMEKDEKKFLSYANFIAETYEKEGEDRKARIIRSKLDGSYKNQPTVTLDSNKLMTIRELGEICRDNGVDCDNCDYQDYCCNRLPQELEDASPYSLLTILDKEVRKL